MAYEKCNWCGGDNNGNYYLVRLCDGYKPYGRYCCERCRQEAKKSWYRGEHFLNESIHEASSFRDCRASAVSAPSRGASPTASRTSSSSSEGGPIQVFIGLLALIAICWGGYRGVKWLFSGSGSVVTETEMLETWQKHIEQRRKAFSDGLSENAVEAKGLVNYTWEEWQNRQKEKQLESTGKTNAEVIGDKAKEIWQDVSTTKVKEVGEKAKAFWRGLTSKEEKNPEEELKRLNARLAELEGTSKMTAGVASNSYSCDVQFSGDERIVTVTSEYGTRASAWQVAIRAAVEAAVLNFVSDSNLLRANRAKLRDRLNFVDKTDVKKLDVLKDQQVGDVFTVKIRACFDKKSLAPKFKDIFPTYFAIDEMVDPRAPRGASSDSVPTSNAQTVKPETSLASTSSKRIGITVKGKGKTKEIALRNAFHEAVWKTAGTWVGSKEKILVNREKLRQQVKTITESDIAKYEILETTRESDGAFVVKVKVSVSKQQVAPKLAPVFPDVFAND